MFTMSHDGNTVLVTAYATDIVKSPSTNIIYISLAGSAEASTRAVAAAFLGRKEVEVRDRHLKLAQHQQYKLVKDNPIDPETEKRVYRRTIFHPAFTTLSIEDHVYLFDDRPGQPPSQFWPRMMEYCRVPKLPEWESWMWEKGKDKTLAPDVPTFNAYSKSYSWYNTAPIKRLEGYECDIWKVSLSRRVWHAVMAKHFGWEIPLQYNRDNNRYEGGDWSLGTERDSGLFAAVHAGEVLKPRAKFVNNLTAQIGYEQYVYLQTE